LASFGIVLGLAMAPSRVRAFTRTASGDGGTCLFWGPRTVHYRLNATGVSSMSFGALQAAVDRGFAAWTGWRCSDFTYVDDGTTRETQVGYNRVLVSQPALALDATNTHLVVFRERPCSEVVPAGDDCQALANDDCDNKYDCWDDSADLSGDTLAYTLVTSERSSGRIVDADVAFDASDFQFKDLASGACDDGVDPASCADVQNAMAHEAGHFLGLGHSTDRHATMFGQVLTAGEVSKRNLARDDVNGLCAIYPAGLPPVRCAPVPERDVEAEGCGCGAGSAAAPGWVLLLPLGLLAKRRRLQ